MPVVRAFWKVLSVERFIPIYSASFREAFLEDLVRTLARVLYWRGRERERERGLRDVSADKRKASSTRCFKCWERQVVGPRRRRRRHHRRSLEGFLFFLAFVACCAWYVPCVLCWSSWVGTRVLVRCDVPFRVSARPSLQHCSAWSGNHGPLLLDWGVRRLFPV